MSEDLSAAFDRRLDRTPVGARAQAAHGYVLRRLLAAADAVGIAVAFGVAVAIGGLDEPVEAFGLALLLLPLWILLFKAYGLYDRDGKRVSHSTIDDVPWLFHALLFGAVALWLITRAVPSLQVSVWGGAAFLGAAFLVVSVSRAVARSLAYRFIRPERVLFVGGGEMAQLLVTKIGAHPEYGLLPIGFIDGDVEAAKVGSLPCLGSLADLEQVCRVAGVERLVIASPNVEEATLAGLVRVAAGLDVRISILPQLSDVLGPSVTIDDVEGITVLGLNPPALSPSSRLLKRAMDVVVAVSALVLLLPLLVVISLLVKFTSRGPVLFTQERIGRNGKRFTMRKFRTMVVDAERRVDELKKLSGHPAWLLLEHDPRITRVGRVLRKFSLDEVPQFWNVICGDMSLVGPRPMPPDVDDHIDGWGRRRLDLTPGISGLWQVLGRTSIPFEEMVKLDYLYVTNWSLWQDTRLLIRTLPAVLRQRGAN